MLLCRKSCIPAMHAVVYFVLSYGPTARVTSFHRTSSGHLLSPPSSRVPTRNVYIRENGDHLQQVHLI